MDRFISRFIVPDVALPVIELIVNTDEILSIEALDSESFNTKDAKLSLEMATGENWQEERIRQLLCNAYKRGVILLQDESFTRFKTGTFYGRLDIFAITEPEKYLALPRKTQIALDDWYFNAYLNRLGDVSQPSGDKVVTMQQALEFIDTIDCQIWLNSCDCRTLAGYCDKPTDTCISFRSGINTMSHRGWSKPVTKDEVKTIIRRANSSGLMQTINHNGLCNCCGDCCYLFRAQRARKRGVVWPVAENIASFDSSTCMACGLCTERCHFNAFSFDGDKIGYKPELCRGCGLCAETCPSSAITMKRRR